MKITLNRKNLLTALDAVSPGVTVTTTAPEMQYVLLAVRGNVLALRTQSHGLGAIADVTGTGTGDGQTVVSHSLLCAMLQSNSEDVELELVGNELKLRSGKTKAGIPASDPTKFTAAINVDDGAFLATPGKQLAELLATACAAAGDSKSSRAWHEGVLLQSCPDGIKILSGDGKQFSKAFMPERASKDFAVVVPGKSLRSILSHISESESVSVSCTEKGVEVNCEAGSFKLTALDVKYPPVETVSDRFDSDCKNHATVSREALLHSLRMASVLTTTLDYNVKIAVDGGLHVTSERSSAGQYEDTVPVQGSPQILKPTGINHRNFIAHLQSLNCANVTLWYYDDALAIRVTPAEPGTTRAYYSSAVRRIEKAQPTQP